MPTGEYGDVYGKKTIRATRPVIVFTKYEACGILYADYPGAARADYWC